MTTVQLASFLNRLRLGGPVNDVAIALILTEAKFRPLYFRIAEAFVAIFCLFVLRREPMLTLGKCQVSFYYWRQRFGKNSLALVLATFKVSDCYDVACDYLADKKALGIRDTLIKYNGKPSRLYVQMFEKNLMQVRKVALQTRIALV